MSLALYARENLNNAKIASIFADVAPKAPRHPRRYRLERDTENAYLLRTLLGAFRPFQRFAAHSRANTHRDETRRHGDSRFHHTQFA